MFLSAVTANNTTLASTTALATATAPIVKSEYTVTLGAIPEALSQEDIKEPIVSVEQYVKTYFAKNPILAKVAKCESEYRQFGKNGDVIRGMAVKEDVGVMQINETYHKVASEKLGFNIYTLGGNLAYGQYLYDHEGTRPWSASEACWSR